MKAIQHFHQPAQVDPKAMPIRGCDYIDIHIPTDLLSLRNCHKACKTHSQDHQDSCNQSEIGSEIAGLHDLRFDRVAMFHFTLHKQDRTHFG